MFLSKYRRLVESRDGEYGDVAYELEVYDERGVSRGEARFVDVSAKHLNMRAKWREGLDGRIISQYLTFLPWVRGRPLTKDEHIDKVMSKFKSQVDEYNAFERRSARRNDDVSVKGDGVMEVTLGGEDDD